LILYIKKMKLHQFIMKGWIQMRRQAICPARPCSEVHPTRRFFLFFFSLSYLYFLMLEKGPKLNTILWSGMIQRDHSELKGNGDLSINVYSSFLCNNTKLETTQMFTNKWMDEYTVASSGIIVNNKRGWSLIHGWISKYYAE
jgi:hypothetical protein